MYKFLMSLGSRRNKRTKWFEIWTECSYSLYSLSLDLWHIIPIHKLCSLPYTVLLVCLLLSAHMSHPIFLFLPLVCAPGTRASLMMKVSHPSQDAIFSWDPWQFLGSPQLNMWNIVMTWCHPKGDNPTVGHFPFCLSQLRPVGKTKLAGGFKHVLFSSLFGQMSWNHQLENIKTAPFLGRKVPLVNIWRKVLWIWSPKGGTKYHRLNPARQLTASFFLEIHHS